MWSLDCDYYDKSFETINQLIDDVLMNGVDPHHEVLHDGKSIGEWLDDFIVM